MSLWETFTLAVKNISGSKMRTFLTMLGIIIGAGSYTHLDVYKRQVSGFTASFVVKMRSRNRYSRSCAHFIFLTW